MKRVNLFSIPLVIIVAILSSAMGFAATTTTMSTTTTPSVTSPSPVITPTAGDSYITTTIQGKFANDPQLSGSNITIVTQDGVVTLMGTAQTPDQIAEAMSVAKTVAGVKEVKSTVTVGNASTTQSVTTGATPAVGTTMTAPAGY